MEFKGHFKQKVLVMLLMSSVSYAWESDRNCSDQGLPAVGACSRFQRYCPAGTICEESNHIFACKIEVGNNCNTTEQCEEGACCIQNTCSNDIDTGPDGVITSPDYPEYYPANVDQSWQIMAPEGKYIKLTFVEFHVEQWTAGPDPLNYEECNADYVKLFNGIEADAPEILMICGQGDQAPIYSPGNALTILFHSDCCDSYFRGFHIEYRFVCDRR